jgi:hypothetical protein
MTMSIIKMPVKRMLNVSHVARADLVPLAALYYVHVDPDPAKAQSLMAAFCAQARSRAAIELTNVQYHAFKDATKHIVQCIERTYAAYLKEAERLG